MPTTRARPRASIARRSTAPDDVRSERAPPTTAGAVTDDAEWTTYLERFHAQAPGVTERMLQRSRDGHGHDPYRWAARAVPAAGAVIDVACGSAPLAEHVDHDRYLGVDRSAAELSLASHRATRVVRGDATALPLRDGSAATVTCLMALMLTQPLQSAVAEIARVLRPEGTLVTLLPGRAPDGVTDALRWAAVFAAVGWAALRWPNPQTLDKATDWLGEAFTVVVDESRSFAFPVETEVDARQFVASLYLPDVSDARRTLAEKVASDWIGDRIGIPLRLIVARRT
jgi:SAM-dependent methyltransferase